jgi:uncharacterized protein YndB with AHSA1/START domain
MQDAIIKEITVKAPKERVYSAITDPKQIIMWFPDGVEGQLEVGQQPKLIFEGHGKTSIYVAAAEPYEYFAFRWVPGGANTVDDVLAVQTTLIEFRIEETGDGTKITVKESGFAAFPADFAVRAIKEDSDGWEYMMGRLEKAMNEV